MTVDDVTIIMIEFVDVLGTSIEPESAKFEKHADDTWILHEQTPDDTSDIVLAVSARQPREEIVSELRDDPSSYLSNWSSMVTRDALDAYRLS